MITTLSILDFMTSLQCVTYDTVWKSLWCPRYCVCYLYGCIVVTFCILAVYFLSVVHYKHNVYLLMYTFRYTYVDI